MTAEDEKGYGVVRTPGGEELRERLRAALNRCIDPDDDTMPTLDPAGNGFVWVPAEIVIDDLAAAITKEQP